MSAVPIEPLEDLEALSIHLHAFATQQGYNLRPFFSFREGRRLFKCTRYKRQSTASSTDEICDMFFEIFEGAEGWTIKKMNLEHTHSLPSVTTKSASRVQVRVRWNNLPRESSKGSDNTSDLSSQAESGSDLECDFDLDARSGNDTANEDENSPVTRRSATQYSPKASSQRQVLLPPHNASASVGNGCALDTELSTYRVLRDDETKVTSSALFSEITTLLKDVSLILLCSGIPDS